MLFTSLPYVLGFAAQGDAWRFSGFVFGVEDGNSYLGKMLRGSAGEWLFRTPYSADPQSGALIFVPYILLGKLAAPPDSHAQLVSLFHLFRFGAGILAILATYDFLAVFCTAIWARRAGVILSVFGGGLGWLMMLAGKKDWLGSLPLEFYSPESFGFLGVFGVPHLALARALLLWTLVWYLRISFSKERVSGKSITVLGLLWLFTSLVQPLTGMVIGFVLGVYLIALAGWQVWRKAKGESVDWPKWGGMFRIACVAAIIPAPYLLYNLLSFRIDVYLRNWTLQNKVLSPHPVHYLLAYGIILPLVFIGAKRLLEKDAWRGWMVVAWVASLPILAYAPFTLQRRLPEGIWVAMIALVMVAIEQLRINKRARLILVSGVLVILCLSTLIIWIGSLQAALTPGSPLFVPRDQTRIFEYLELNARKDQVVLAGYETGNVLPAWTPQYVAIGHGPESVHFAEISRRVADIFDGHSTEENRLSFLEDLSVDFVVWGPAERELGNWNPEQARYLKKVFEQGEYALFEVIPFDD